MGQLAPYLLLLACPVGMGLMMWVMMRGSGGPRRPPPQPPTPAQHAERDRLRAELEELRGGSDDTHGGQQAR